MKIKIQITLVLALFLIAPISSLAQEKPYQLPGGDAWLIGQQSTPKPSMQGIISCKENNAGDAIICTGEKGAKFSISIKDNLYDKNTILNDIRDALLYPKLFYFDPQSNRILHVAPKLKEEYIKRELLKNPYTAISPTKIVSYERPLSTLNAGEMKPVPFFVSTMHLGLAKDIIDTLRPSLNENIVKFPSGTPLLPNMFSIYPRYISNDPSAYTLKDRDGKNFPLVFTRSFADGRRRLAIDFKMPSFRQSRVDIDPASPVISQNIPTDGPGSTSQLNNVAPTIREEVSNALATGQISWCIFIEIYSISLGGDPSLNNSMHAITDKDGSHIGFMVALPGKIKSTNAADFIEYIFTDEKNADGLPGKDGIFETVRLYQLGSKGAVEIIVQSPIKGQNCGALR